MLPPTLTKENPVLGSLGAIFKSITLIQLAMGLGILTMVGWGACSLIEFGEDRATVRIEKANLKKQKVQRKKATKNRVKAKGKARDLEGCTGWECVNIFDGIFK